MRHSNMKSLIWKKDIMKLMKLLSKKKRITKKNILGNKLLNSLNSLLFVKSVRNVRLIAFWKV